LTRIRLNVASIEVEDRSPPASGDSLEALDPVRPADALKQMAIDRLSADGSAGRAVFVIDQAQLRRVRGGVEGAMTVRLDVFAGAGDQRAGYAEARVSRRRTSTDGDENLRTVLYNFTMQMMNDMNVEFEYQIRRSLRDWVQTTSGSAPPPPPVQAQPLPGPGQAASSPAPSAPPPEPPPFSPLSPGAGVAPPALPQSAPYLSPPLARSPSVVSPSLGY
jgi:hypothetical protein